MSLNNTEKNDNSQSLQGIHHFWKQPGETLAVMLRRFREEQGMGEDEKLTYAGRLDPMAEGIVPILSGEARFRKEQLMSAAKTYEVEILLGVSTDTGDMLGLVTKKDMRTIESKEIGKAIESLSSIQELVYPNYSSRPVDGKPLFVHARAGNKVQQPMKKVSIHALELLGITTVSLNSLIESASEIINTVHGDFRQEAILAGWQKQKGNDEVQVVSIRTTVSSGAYMRSLAEKLGELLGMPALAYRIVRTKISSEK